MKDLDSTTDGSYINNKLKAHTYCSWCGRQFAEQEKFPRECGSCLSYTYKNPIPVIQIMYAGLVPDIAPYEKYGILVQQRNIEPKKGEWALPGGYMELGETWQEAASRELKEETGLITDPQDFYLENIRNSSNGNLLIFVKNKTKVDVSNFKFETNSEVQDAKFIFEPMELAFPTHTEEANKYLEKLKEMAKFMATGSV